jgi:hypothetical protein
MNEPDLDDLIPENRPRSMAGYLELERKWQASGRLDAEALAKSIEFCREIESRSKEETEAFDLFLSHMPEDQNELTLVILKGHLLVESKILEFVLERLLSPAALVDARLSSHQLVCLAESLCLPNEEPKWLWQMARRLNKLRNDLAHNLEPKDIEARVKQFVLDYKRLHAVQADLFGCLGHFYSQITALATLAREPEFRVRGR